MSPMRSRVTCSFPACVQGGISSAAPLLRVSSWKRTDLNPMELRCSKHKPLNHTEETRDTCSMTAVIKWSVSYYSDTRLLVHDEVGFGPSGIQLRGFSGSLFSISGRFLDRVSPVTLSRLLCSLSFS
eukprot:1759714-Pyramimonas_sp.AAC.1